MNTIQYEEIKGRKKKLNKRNSYRLGISNDSAKCVGTAYIYIAVTLYHMPFTFMCLPISFFVRSHGWRIEVKKKKKTAGILCTPRRKKIWHFDHLSCCQRGIEKKKTMNIRGLFEYPFFIIYKKKNVLLLHTDSIELIMEKPIFDLFDD